MLVRNPKATKYDIFNKWILKLGTKHMSQCFKKAKDVLDNKISVNQDFDSILLLHYYRNGIVHLFVNEALIACSLKGFKKEEIEEGVPLEELWEKTKFLAELLSNEYMIEKRLSTFERFEEVIHFMVDRGTLDESYGRVSP